MVCRIYTPWTWENIVRCIQGQDDRDPHSKAGALELHTAYAFRQDARDPYTNAGVLEHRPYGHVHDLYVSGDSLSAQRPFAGFSLLLLSICVAINLA